MQIYIEPALRKIYKKYLKNEKLVTTLYYTTNTTEQLNFIPYIPNSVFSGLTMTYMTTDNTFTTLDKKKLITFNGYRLVPVNNNIDDPQYNETFTITTPDGNLVATATYIDNGTSFITELDKLEYMVLNGSGIFSNAFKVIIHFDNTGDKFGTPFSRHVEIYKHYI